jgi:hypothetical protein
MRADLRTGEINLFQVEILSGSDRECNASLGKKRFPGSEQRSNLRTREVTSMNTEFCSERRFFHNVDENATIL